MTSKKKKAEPVEIVHGVESAYYNNLPSQHPEMECLCGFITEGAFNWEEAGAQMDAHIEEEAE